MLKDIFKKVSKGQFIQSLITDAWAFGKLLGEKKLVLQLQVASYRALPGKDMTSRTITRHDFYLVLYMLMFC